MSRDKTLIAAPATPPGIGGVAIIRLSGTGAYEKAGLFLPPGKRERAPLTRRKFFYCVFRKPTDGSKLDEGIVLGFPSPHSYTGEEVVEFQLHGGRLSARRMLEALLAEGVRMAEPGEFTKRAFLNGRIDLSQAEAVLDLVSAQSERAMQMALEQLQGALSRRLNAAYDALLNICADIEASLDFDEDDVPEELSFDELEARMKITQSGLERLLSTWREGQLLRDGAVAVISGRPNAGKSALFNALLGRDRAIVTAHPGTTRDTLEETIVLDGIPLRLMDTAGLRETPDQVEREGVERAREALSQAQLHLRVIDPADPLETQDIAALRALPPETTVVALSKADMFPDASPELPPGYITVRTSSVTGEGLRELKSALLKLMGVDRQTESVVMVNARHREALADGIGALKTARELCPGGDAVLVAQALRESAGALGAVTGRDVGEDVLDRLFERFCIGK